MFDHVSIGVSDVARAKRFYDAALGPLGYTCLSESDDSLGYGNGNVALWVQKAGHPVKPDMSSGLHFCFTADSRKGVEQFHQRGLAAGGSDNGAPGPRDDYGENYFAAFVIDPDGYRLEAYCSKPAST